MKNSVIVYDYQNQKTKGDYSMVFLRPGLRDKYPFSIVGKLVQRVSQKNLSEYAGANIGGGVLGYIDINASYAQMASRAAEVSWLTVKDPALLNKGFARDMLEVALQHLGGEGISRLTLEALNNTQGLYEKLGFVETGSTKGLRANNIPTMVTDIGQNEASRNFDKFNLNMELSRF